MRLKPHILNSILLTLSISLWILILIFHTVFHALQYVYKETFDITHIGYSLAYAGFIVCNTLYFNRIYSKIERLNVITLLWRLFIIGMGGITLILILIITYFLTRQFTLNAYLKPVLYSISLYALLIFFLATTFVYRRFVLYQRTKRKLKLWNAFLIGLGLSLLMMIPFPNVYTVSIIFFMFFVLLCLFLSANVRWIAYLNFNQKLKALGLFTLILVLAVTYIIIGGRFPSVLEISIILPTEIFLYCIIAFTVIYSLSSILVLFFNLPTSSIFELKSLEIVSFNKINQAIQSNLDYSAIINSLLDASLLAANAKTGWIEMISEDKAVAEIRLHKRITPKEIKELIQGNELTKRVLEDQRLFQVKNLRNHKAFKHNNTKFRSLLCVPIMSSNHTYGAIFVANELANSFEDVTLQSITTFSEQAGMALENAKLIKSSIELERYQEQLKIAKEVQTQLLPQSFPYSSELEFAAESENAQEVGGDYFDIVEAKNGIYKVAIGDVSGKGTTAAFYMAETKGIFHALSLLDIDPKTFIASANMALAKCIQKGFFVTLTYLQIDTINKEVELIRAGHCPTFYYDAEKDAIELLRDGTLGLGIVRNDSFSKFISNPEVIKYQTGDFMVLYTDGIIEARNEEGEEFGYERFEEIIMKHKKAGSKDLAAHIVQAARDFTHSDIEDDYTVLVIRFN